MEKAIEILVRIFGLLIAAFLVVTLGIYIIDRLSQPKTDKFYLRLESEIQVEPGYELVDVSEWGRFNGYSIYYFWNIETNQIYECADDLCKEIVIPEGFSFVGASSWGEFYPFTTYYCLDNNSGRIFKCIPQ